MEPIKVLVIGVGYIGRFHLEKYFKLPQVEVVGVLDKDPDKVLKYTQTSGRAGFFSLDALLDYLKQGHIVDAVSICVPTQLHAQFALPLIARGIHVLLEKPITSEIAAGEQVVAAARKAGIVLQIGHLERFNPAFRAVRPYISSPAFIEAHRLSFFQERSNDIDVIADLMVHDLDIILSIVPSAVKDIAAAGVCVMTDKVDIANVRLSFENGAVANITASRVSMKKMRKVRIFQLNKYIAIDFDSKAVSVIVRKENAADRRFSSIEAIPVEVSNRDTMELEIESFVNAIQEGFTPIVTGEDGLAALKLAREIEQKVSAYVENFQIAQQKKI